VKIPPDPAGMRIDRGDRAVAAYGRVGFSFRCAWRRAFSSGHTDYDYLDSHFNALRSAAVV
jgi:hypothetical protein